MQETDDKSAAAITLTEAILRAIAARAFHAAPSDDIFDPRTGRSWGRGDWDLNPEMLADFSVMPPPRPAAVLVPIVARDDGLTLLLTQRTEQLSTHAGQIAFPGGKVEESDASPVAAALREAEEEIGLAASQVEPLGFLDSYRTGTGFLISPVVAIIRPGFTLTPDASEVADVFEVPLGFLMNPENHRQGSRVLRGGLRTFYEMPFGERYIWGITAGIIRALYERVFA